MSLQSAEIATADARIFSYRAAPVFENLSSSRISESGRPVTHVWLYPVAEKDSASWKASSVIDLNGTGRSHTRLLNSTAPLGHPQVRSGSFGLIHERSLSEWLPLLILPRKFSQRKLSSTHPTCPLVFPSPGKKRHETICWSREIY